MRRLAALSIALPVALGAACGGSSSPVLLAAGETQPSAIAVQGSFVYWVEQATQTSAAAVRRVPVNGGVASTVVSVATPRALVLSGTQAIVGNHAGTVYQVAQAGGALSVLIPADADPVLALAVQGDFVYVAYNSGSLARVSVTAGPNSLVALDSANNQVVAIAADSTNLYWVTDTGDVFKQPGDGSGTSVLIASLAATAPTAMVALGGALYLVGATELVSVATATGAVALVLDTGSSCPPPRMCSSAFWGLATNGSLLFVGLDHGITQVDPATHSAPLVVSASLAGTSLAADGANVYWAVPSSDANGNPLSTSDLFRAGF